MVFPYPQAGIDLDFTNERYYDRYATSYTAGMLLHMDGTNGSTTFTDSVGSHTVTPSGTAQISTAQSMFGGASAVFDGTSALSLDATADFNIGQADFTVDFWVRPTTLSDGVSESVYDTNWPTVPNFELYLYTSVASGGSAIIFWSDGAIQLRSAYGSIAVDNWYHIALTRRGGITRLFLGGVVCSSYFGLSSYVDFNNYGPTTSYPKIGSGLIGYMDELRFIKGYAAWASNFTPPVAAYTDFSGALPTVPVETQLACSRASVGYAKRSNLTITEFASNVLRITDLGLLIEDTRTNSCTYSDQIAIGAGWTVQGGAAGAAVVEIAPTGESIAVTQLNENTTSTTFYQTFNSSPGNLSGFNTFSVYLQAHERSWAFVQLDNGDNIGAFFDLGNGVVGSDTGVTSKSIEPMIDGWYRCSITRNATITGAQAKIALSLGDGAANTSYAGTVGFGLHAWGAQVEAGSFASSYIPTTTTSAARAADAVTCAGDLDSVLSGTKFSLVMSLFLLSAQNLGDRIFGAIGVGDVISDGTTDRDRYSWSSRSSYYGDKGNFQAGGVLGISTDGVTSSSTADGGLVVDDTSVSGSFASVQFFGPTQYSYGYVRRFTVWTARLLDSSLSRLTAPAPFVVGSGQTILRTRSEGWRWRRNKRRPKLLREGPPWPSRK